MGRRWQKYYPRTRSFHQMINFIKKSRFILNNGMVGPFGSDLVNELSILKKTHPHVYDAARNKISRGFVDAELLIHIRSQGVSTSSRLLILLLVT
jgi:predicted ATPase